MYICMYIYIHIHVYMVCIYARIGDGAALGVLQRIEPNW